MAKVVLLSTRYDLGGAPLLASQIGAALRERGHVAEAWFLYFQSDRKRGEEPYSRIFLPHPPNSRFDIVRIVHKLQRAMRQFRPDAFFGVQPLANVLGATAAMLAGCPRRFGGQHNPSFSQRPSLRSLERWVGTFAYTGNVMISNAVAASYADYPARYRTKTLIIYNGVRERGSKLSRSVARRRFELPESAFLIGTVGVHNHQKNHPFLFDLLTELPSNVHLAIVGDGEERAVLEEHMRQHETADRVHLLGALPSEQIYEFLDALDVFVFPSRFEGFGLALVEAMQSRLPVIVNDVPVLREILQDGAFGDVIAVEDRHAWVSRICMLKDDPDLYEQQARAARLGVEGRFSFSRMIDRYDKLCR